MTPAQVTSSRKPKFFYIRTTLQLFLQTTATKFTITVIIEHIKVKNFRCQLPFDGHSCYHMYFKTFLYCFATDLSHSETRLSVYLDNVEMHVYNRTAVYSNLEKLFGIDQILPHPSEEAQELVTSAMGIHCAVFFLQFINNKQSWLFTLEPFVLAHCSMLAYCSIGLVLRSLGCIHIGTSTSPGTRVRVLVNTSLRVFQRWPFTLTQVLYEYELPVNFTRTSSFLTGRVFIQFV